MTYHEWLAREAALVNSDGCTLVSEWNQPCCHEHDLTIRKGKDPRVAFEKGWDAALAMTRTEADRRYWRCNRTASPSLWGRLRADLRYLGVRIGTFLGV